MDMHAAQAEPQIAAEQIHVRHVVKISVGGGHQSEVTCAFAHFPDGAEAVLFQCAEKGTLRGQRQFAHFIQKERALIRGGQQTFPRPIRAGKGPARVSEQVGFHQTVRHGSAVHGDPCRCRFRR